MYREGGMSQSVDRLKELLFDTETRELSEMQRRVELLLDRAGTDEKFTSSVAGVLDRAFREAEVDRHAELADAVAPLVVRTVKSEIRNSRDDLVEALYPVTGRMVKAYVASAMKDLVNDINRRLEANPVMLRLRSLTSGRSVAELALAETQQLHIEELYLVRRGTGELIGRWPESTELQSRDHVMSGILTAINEFSSEALADQGSSLRQIDLGERQLYLRASQSYLLAAKCRGTAHPAVEAILDEAFLSTLESIQKDRDDHGSIEAAATQRAALLADVSRGLDGTIGAKQAKLAGRGVSPLLILAWLIGLPLAAWIAWSAYGSYKVNHAMRVAFSVLASSGDMKGYPAEVTVASTGASLTVSGLAPSLPARTRVVSDLRSALPGIEIRDQLTVLPSGMAEIEPVIEGVKQEVGVLKAGVEPELAAVKRQLAAVVAQSKTAGVVGALERSSRRLSEVDGDLSRLGTAVKEESPRAVVQRASEQVKDALKDLATYKARTTGRGLEGLAELTPSLNAHSLALKKTTSELSGLIATGMATAFAARTERAAPADIGESADEFAAESERLGALTTAVSQAVALKAMSEPTARDRLTAWSGRNAIFFSNGVDYRNAVQADATLDSLVELMRGNDVVVRVVGYTDERGGQDRNTSLSKSRAQKVADALIARNIPPSRIVPVGRLDALDISPTEGASSPNRRVQFEIGFDGELAQ